MVSSEAVFIEKSLSPVFDVLLGTKTEVIFYHDCLDEREESYFTIEYENHEKIFIDSNGIPGTSFFEKGLNLLKAASSLGFKIGGNEEAAPSLKYRYLVNAGEREKFFIRSNCRKMEDCSSLPKSFFKIPVHLSFLTAQNEYLTFENFQFIKLAHRNLFKVKVWRKELNYEIEIIEKVNMETVKLPVKINIGTLLMSGEEIISLRPGEKFTLPHIENEVLLELEGKKFALGEVRTKNGASEIEIKEILPD